MKLFFDIEIVIIIILKGVIFSICGYFVGIISGYFINMMIINILSKNSLLEIENNLTPLSYIIPAIVSIFVPIISSILFILKVLLFNPYYF
jgi:ABC-type antimicrobial peptide transport system permease subunit